MKIVILIKNIGTDGSVSRLIPKTYSHNLYRAIMAPSVYSVWLLCSVAAQENSIIFWSSSLAVGSIMGA
jgi:hypothetical protein